METRSRFQDRTRGEPLAVGCKDSGGNSPSKRRTSLLHEENIFYQRQWFTDDPVMGRGDYVLVGNKNYF
jgi:hypothetical protein